MRGRFKIAVIVGIAGVLVAGSFVYGMAVGRYQFPPYRQVSPIYQGFSDVRRFLAEKSPLGSEESIKAEEESLKAKERRLELVSSVADSVTDLVLASYKSYEVKLGSPIGYTIENSIRSGDSIRIYVHNTETTSVDVYRLGRRRSKVESLGVLPQNHQSPLFSPYRGFDWEPTITLDTDGYRSGYYLVELTGRDTGNRYQIPLIVTPSQPPRIAFVSQTNTWHAYNSYGGLAFYIDSRRHIYSDVETRDFNMALKDELPHHIHLPYARPYAQTMRSPDIPQVVALRPPLNITDETRPEDPFDGHHFRSEWNLIAFAEEHNLEYGVYTDMDLNPDGQILESDVIVFNTHNEYWSREMRDALGQYLAKGGRVVFAGGNSIYREVKHTRYGMRVLRPQIPAYISAPLIGTSYTGDGYRTYGSYKVVNPGHWVFRGTGIRAGDEIGNYSANRPAPGSRGEGEVGASGFETDKVNRYSDLYSHGFETLAVGTNKRGPAYMVFKKTEAGGWVFNAGSIAFTGALFHDPAIDRLMLNLLGGT